MIVGGPGVPEMLSRVLPVLMLTSLALIALGAAFLVNRPH
jgi:hypothetical protein